MVAFIYNEVPIVADQIIDYAVSDQALDHRHIQQAGGLFAAAADPANGANRHSQEGGKSLDPLLLQLPPMHQYERIDAAFGDQPRGHHGLSERSGGGQYSRVLGKHGLGGDGLLGAQFTLECHVQRLARVALVLDYWLDVQSRQGLKQVIQAAARQSNVLGDDPRRRR